VSSLYATSPTQRHATNRTGGLEVPGSNPGSPTIVQLTWTGLEELDGFDVDLGLVARERLLVALPRFLVALVVQGGRQAHPNALNNGRVESGT